MGVGIKNNIFCFRLSLFHRKRKKQFEYTEKKKKKAKALESKKSLFLEVSVVQFSNQRSTQFQLSFQQVKVKVCSIAFHSHMYEDSDPKLRR